MSYINYRPTSQQEGQARSEACKSLASLSGGGSIAVGGSVIHDDDGDVIGRVYTLAEVCDEVRQ